MSIDQHRHYVDVFVKDCDGEMQKNIQTFLSHAFPPIFFLDALGANSYSASSTYFMKIPSFASLVSETTDNVNLSHIDPPPPRYHDPVHTKLIVQVEGEGENEYVANRIPKNPRDAFSDRPDWFNEMIWRACRELRTGRPSPVPCSSCGKNASALCTSCGIVSYCNRDCQKQHRTIHKKWCMIMKSKYEDSAKTITFEDASD